MDPLVFEPYLRPQIWGGRKLDGMLGKPLPATGRYGESWEISAHPSHVTRVSEGPLRGTPLTELPDPDLYGPQTGRFKLFPLLVKLLDAHDLLSIQVHPDDATAKRLLGEDQGKTEAWVVLDVAPGGTIYAGLKPGTTRAEMEKHLTDGKLENCLHAFTPRAGDCLFLRAGTVHAVGGGVVMAEVQQTSDATFRLYDWNRLGTDGKPRQLHVRESFESINWDFGPLWPVSPTPLTGEGSGGNRGERLVDCPYFRLDRFRIERPLPLPYGDRLSIWMVLEGFASLTGARKFRHGETILVPATAGPRVWEPAGHATLLSATLP